MQTRLKYKILSILIITCLNLIAQAEQPFKLNKIPLRSHFDQNNYNAGIQNWGFDQDKNGILYVANNDGVLEFDGENWNQLTVPLSTRIRAVKIDKSNKIFIGGQNQIGYFTKSVNGFKYTSLNNKIISDNKSITEVWKILKINEEIFFNADNDLLLFEKGKVRKLNVPGYVLNSFNINDTLYTHIYNKGIYKYVNNKFRFVKNTKKIPDLTSIFSLGNKKIYFSNNGDIFKEQRLDSPYKKYSIKFGTLNHVVRLSNGDFAVGTQNKGLFILDQNLKIKNHYTKNSGLSNTTVKAIYEDNFNNLWLALNNGIDYLKMSLPFALINEEVGVFGTGYAAHKYNDRIYLGTSNGVFTQKNSIKKNYSFNFLDGSEGQVYNFSQINNSIFLNSHNGAHEIRNLKLNKFHDIGSWNFIKTKDPKLIIGGDYQGIRFFKKKNNQWKNIGEIPNLSESSRIIHYQNDSTLWMTHGYKGAYKIDIDNNYRLKSRVKHFGLENGFPSNILISAYNLNDKLVFTSENGIFDYDPDLMKFKPNITFDKILGKDHVSAMECDKNNTIYYIQNKELGVLKEKNFGEFSKETGIFKHINKLINDDLPKITTIDEENIIIGAKEGFIHYNPTKSHNRNKNFTTIIREIEISEKNDSLKKINPSYAKGIKLNSEEIIKINYSSPYFDGFEDLKYSYKLTPLDKSWSQWSSNNSKGYDHLPYGNYIFEVKASNIYGEESISSKLDFTFKAPWYASKSAKICYFSLGLLAFILIPIIQSKRYTTVAEEIEKELKIKEEEIDKLNSEKLKSELKLKNEQLTSITMQLLKNKEFILNIQDKIESTLKEGNSKIQLQRLIKTIDSEVSKNDNWDEFAYHFDQVHGNYLEYLSNNNIRLSPREIKLAAFLRMNMSSKEISKLLNITTRGVELARYRLRKKLSLSREQNLVEFLISLDKS